ncbi:hypothetical protein J6590_078915 [Homalodisca vitripennis]|nr:hypothetical protein J6590_078915 [Homalodisca vitripennis]
MEPHVYHRVVTSPLARARPTDVIATRYLVLCHSENTQFVFKIRRATAVATSASNPQTGLRTTPIQISLHPTIKDDIDLLRLPEGRLLWRVQCSPISARPVPTLTGEIFVCGFPHRRPHTLASLFRYCRTYYTLPWPRPGRAGSPRSPLCKHQYMTENFSAVVSGQPRS